MNDRDIGHDSYWPDEPEMREPDLESALAKATRERIAADDAFAEYEEHYWNAQTLGELAGAEARYNQFNDRVEKAYVNEAAAIRALRNAQ